MTIAAPSSSAWFDLLRGSNFDPNNDQQANSSNDLVGSATDAMMQGQIVSSGGEDVIYLRARMGESSAQTAVYLGIDTNLDGRIDLFVEANGTSGSPPFVSFHAADPSKAGTGPSNTGWLSTPSNSPSETKLADGNFYFDKTVSAGTDLDSAGGTDSWYEFGFRLSDLNSFAALGSSGQQLTLDTPIAIYTFTSTSQTSNGDTGGIDDKDSTAYDSTWTSLGIGKVGSLSAMLSGEIIAPTVDTLSTNDSTPLLHGTWGGDMGGGDSLTVTVGSTTYTTEDGLVINGSNWSLAITTPLPTGTYSVTATTSRADSDPVSDTTSSELSIVAPGDSTAPTLTSSSPADNATAVERGSDIVLTFSEPVVAAGGTITLKNAAGVVEVFSLATGLGSLGGSVTISGSTVTLNPGVILDASTTYHVLISSDALTDPSGNAYAGISSATERNFTTGTLAGDPAAPTVTPLTTADTTPLVTGTWGGSNGGVDTLKVTINEVDYTTANGLVINGTTWSLQLPALETGTYTVLATTSRTGGSSTSDTTSNELFIGTSTGTPTAPTVTANTANASPATITGTWGGSNGGTDTLSVTVNGVTYTTANGLSISGTTWSLQLPALANNTHEVGASVSRTGGETATDTSTNELTIAVTPTTTATIVTVTDDVAGTTGTIAKDGQTNDTAPHLAGTLSAPLATGEKLAIYAGETFLGYATADGTGWTFDDSGHSAGDKITYTAVVENGDLSGTASGGYTINIVAIDTLADIVTISDDNGASPVNLAEKAITTDTSPLIEGTLQAALSGPEKLEVLRDGVVIGYATVDGLSWSYSDAGLTPGGTYAYTVRVASGDDHGVESAAHSIIIFAGTPDTPTVTPVDGNDSTPTLTGTWGGDNDGSDTLTVTVNGVDYTLDNGLKIEGTTWSIDLPTLEDGTYEVEANVTRTNGGSASDTSLDELKIDTTPPTTTATIDQVTDNYGPKTGNVTDGGTTDDLTPTLSGGLSAPLAPGETVIVLRDGEPIGTATISPDGTRWTFTDPSAPNNSTAAYTVAVQDDHDNLGDESAARTVSFLSNQGIAASVDASGLDRLEGTLPNVNGLPATTPFTFTVKLSNPLLVAADVDWRVTATGDAPVEVEDFVGYGKGMPSGTVKLAAGATEALVTINVRSDSVWALDQTFSVSLSTTDPDLTLPNQPILGVIRNDDVLAGTSGGDRLTAGSGIDSIYGYGGDDILRGGGGNDLLYGGAGNDTLDGGTGNDLISGDDGTDAVDYSATNDSITIDLRSGSVTLPAAFGIDTLLSIESVLTGGGADSIIGTAGANLLSSGAGSDTIFAAGGNDTIIGGDGTDLLSYAGTSAALSIDLGQTGQQSNGSSGRITVTGIENLIGGSGDDTLTGNAAANRIEGGAGNDSLNGAGGNDTLVGGTGDDTYVFADGEDTVIEDASAGRDRIRSAVTTTLAQNVEELELTGTAAISGTGNALSNLMIGNAQANTLSGGDGNDTLNGGAGADTLLGGEGNDLFIVDSASHLALGEVITGGNGTDELRLASTTWASFVLTSGTSVERVVIGTGPAADAVTSGTASINVNAAAAASALILIGNAGANELTGSAFSDSISGGDGGDLLIGGAGNDTLDGGAGADTLAGGIGNDQLSGGAGFDMVSYAGATDSLTLSLALGTGQSAGSQGTDTLSGFEGIIGGAGSDTLTGDSFANLLIGGAGNDMLDGGAGADTLNGGDGSDTASYALATAAITVSLDLATAQPTGGSDADTLISIENLIGSAFGDLLTGSGAVNRIEGGLGADTIIGGGGADQLFGGDGSDVFIFQSAADFAAGETINGGDGIDELRFAATTAGTLTLSAAVSVERVVIGTGTGANAVSTDGTALNVNAAAMTGPVTLIGNAGANSLTGTAQSDRIEGGAGSDTLIGGGGADTLVGGLGNDALTGGAGADVFIFNTTPGTSNRDTITDFDVVQDRIMLSKAIFPGFASSSTVSDAEFWAAPRAVAGHDATDRLIYNTTTGALYYDVDGSGAKAAVQIAQLSANLILTADDFLLY